MSGGFVRWFGAWNDWSARFFEQAELTEEVAVQWALTYPHSGTVMEMVALLDTCSDYEESVKAYGPACLRAMMYWRNSLVDPREKQRRLGFIGMFPPEPPEDEDDG